MIPDADVTFPAARQSAIWAPKGINPKKGLRKRSFLRIVLISLYG